LRLFDFRHPAFLGGRLNNLALSVTVEGYQRGQQNIEKEKEKKMKKRIVTIIGIVSLFAVPISLLIADDNMIRDDNNLIELRASESGEVYVISANQMGVNNLISDEVDTDNAKSTNVTTAVIQTGTPSPSGT